MMILCLGDSLTFGSVGISYLNFLDSDEKIKNRGVNGDTVACAYLRLKLYLSLPAYDEVDTVIVCIGTNDTVIPYFRTLSPLWRAFGCIRMWQKRCLIRDETFAAQYEKYAKLIQKSGRRGIFIGMPVIQLENIPDDEIVRRNAIIAEIAQKYGMDYVDIYKLQREARETPRLYSWYGRSVERITDAAAMLFWPWTKEGFSKRRGLSLTVDGVHMNTFSAQLLASAVNRLLNRGEETAVK